MHTATEQFIKALRPCDPFNRRAHGSLYDRGDADKHYGRNPDPHYYANGRRVTARTAEEISEYMAGYKGCQSAKDWDSAPCDSEDEE